MLLNIRLLSEVRFSGHKRTAPPKRSMTLAALASPEAPEIPSVRMCMQHGCQRSIIKQGGRQPESANQRPVVIVASAASRERRSAAAWASWPLGARARLPNLICDLVHLPRRENRANSPCRPRCEAEI
jgi:hypothetical protein